VKKISQNQGVDEKAHCAQGGGEKAMWKHGIAQFYKRISCASLPGSGRQKPKRFLDIGVGLYQEEDPNLVINPHHLSRH
jgi:hypothetical protein